MAENYSLQLQLEGYDKFIDQASKIDEKIDEVGKSLSNLADKFNKLDFGNISFDTKALEKLIGLDIKGKGTSLASLVKAYAGLGAEIKAIDDAKLTAINKALSGGATAKTIEAKAIAFGNLATEIGKVSRLKNLDGVPNALRQIFDALSASTNFDVDKIKLIGPAITKLVKSLDSLNELKFSQDTIKYLERLTESLTLLGAGNNITMLKDLIPVIKAISTSFKSFGVSTKTFDAKTLSSNLNAAGSALQKFLEISKQFGGGAFNKTFENFKAMATAVKELGKAFVEFKTPTSSFGDIEKNISSTIRALENLKGQFASFSGATAKSVKTAAESFKAIGDAASSLGARSKSFEKLPDNIQKLNEALLNLDLNRIRQLEPALRAIGPTLQSMANLASVTGRSFSQMGKSASSSATDSTSAFAKFKSGIETTINVIKVTTETFQKLVSIVKNVSVALIKMPFNVINGSIKTTVKTIALPITALDFLGRTAIKVTKELKILQLGLNVLLAPFQLLKVVLEKLGVVFNVFTGILQKAFSFLDKFSVSISKFKTDFTVFGASTDTAKNKVTTFSTTIETLDNKVKNISPSFQQMGRDVSNTITDTSIGRFVQFSSSLQAVSTIGTAFISTLKQMSQGLETFFNTGFNAAASLEDVRKSLNVLNAGDMMRQQTDGTLQLEDAMAQTVVMTDELLERYQRFALEGLFSRKQLTDAHQLAQSLGFTADEAEELVYATADWAAANGLAGEQIKALILPLGQIRSLQKANTVDLKQTITAGNVPAFELLRQELERVTGKMVTMTEAQDLLSAGMVSSDVAINAILTGFRTFQGASAASLGTLSGLANAFGDFKEGIITSFLTPVLSSEEGVRDLLTTMLGADNILSAFKRAAVYGRQFAAVVVPAVQNVVKAITWMTAIWDAVPEPIKETIFFALKFVAITATLTAGIFAVTTTISTLVSGFGLFVGVVPLAVASVASFATALILNFDGMRKAIADVLWSFSEIPAIIRTVGKALQQVFNNGSYDINVFKELSTLSRYIAVGLTDGFSVIGSALSATWNATVTWAGQFGDLAVTLYGYGVDTMLAFADGIWYGATALVNAFSGISNLFTTWFKPASPPKVAEGLDTWGEETAVVYVDGLTEGIKNSQKTFIDSVKEMFGAIRDAGILSVGLVAGTIVNALVTAINLALGSASILLLPAGLILSTGAALIDTLFLISVAATNAFVPFEAKTFLIFSIIGNFIRQTLTLVIDALSVFVANSIGLFTQLGSFAGRELQIIGQMITEAFPNTLGDAGDSINAIGTSMVDGILEAEEGIAKSIKKLGDKLKTNLNVAISNSLLPATNFFLALISSTTSKTEILLKLFEASAKSALNVFSAIGLFSFNVVTTSVVSLINVLKSLYGIFVSIGQAVVDEVVLAIDTLVNIFTVVTDPILSFKDKFIRVFNEIGYFITGTFSNIGGIFTGIFTGIQGVLLSFLDFLNGIFLSGLISLAYAFPNTFGTIYTDIVAFTQETSKIISDFVNGNATAFGSLLQDMVDYGSGLINAFADGILDAVSIVADALAALGEMITFWLAPGSPPRLLPDIDEWGTAAAQEFLDGFSDADLNTINDFGKTIEQTLDKLGVDGVNTEEVTRAFATGLDNLNKDGEFGADVMQRIVDLTASAGPEVASLTSKYKSLAEEQVKLNKTTSEYNDELAKAQGTLDTLNSNEEISSNEKRLANLNAALSNTYLTTEERTKIQTQIDKLQATNKVKQLEQQKKAQESNVDSVAQSIDKQKQLLELSDAFDGKKQSSAINAIGDATTKAGDAAAKQAEAAAKRMTALQLQQQLAGKTTEQQIAIYQEYLSTLTEGSEEYIKVQTKLIELEVKLGKERESSAKAAGKGLGKEAGLAAKFGEGIANAGSPFAKVAEQIKTKTEEVTNSFSLMTERVKAIWGTFKTFFAVGEVTGFIGGFDFSDLNRSAMTLGIVFGTISKYIKEAVGWFNKYIWGVDLIRNAIISLGVVLATGAIVAKIQGVAIVISKILTPTNLWLAALVSIGLALQSFVTSSGGFEATLQRLSDAWSRFTSAFSAGKFATDFKLNFSSLESAATTLGLIFGTTFFSLSENIQKLFTTISTAWNDGIATFSEGLDFSGFQKFVDFVSKNWIEVTTGLVAIFVGVTSGSWLSIIRGISLIVRNFTLPEDIFSQTLLDFLWVVKTNFREPILQALTENDTVLGKIAGVFKAFYIGLGNTITLGLDNLFSGVDSGGLSRRFEEFFETTTIGRIAERNVNEAVNALNPAFKQEFDMSTLTLTGGFDLSQASKQFFGEIDAFVDKVKEFIDKIRNNIFFGNIFATVKDAFADFFKTITSSQFISAMNTIIKTLGLVIGGFIGLVAALTTAGLVGILKNILDLFIVVGQGLQTVYVGIQQIISGNILSGVVTIFGGISTAITGVFDVIGQTIADTILAMVAFFSPAWAQKLEPIISTIAKLIVSFLGWQGVVGRVLGFFGKIFAPFLKLFQTTNVAVGGTTKALTGFQRIMEPFSIVLKNVGNAFKAGWKAVLQFSEQIPGLQALLISLKNLFMILLQPIQTVIGWLVQLWKYMFPPKAGPGLFTKIFDALVAGFNKLASYVPTVTSALQSVWKFIMNIANAVFFVASKIVEFIALLGQLAFNLVKAVVTSNAFTGVLTWIINLVKALWSVFTLVGKVIFKFAEYIFNIGKEFWIALKPIETFMALLRTVQVIAELLGASLLKVASTAISFGIAIRDAFNNGITQLLQIDYVADFVAWSSGWVEAIWIGLKTFVTNIPTKIMEWTKAFAEWLEPHSPPKFLPDLVEWGTEIGLILLKAIVGIPLNLLMTWGTNIGNAIVNFDWLQFADDLGAALTGLVSASISKVVKVGVAVSDFIFVNPGEQMMLAEEIYKAMPNVDAIFGEDSTKKIALNLADIITINPVEFETATGYFQDFGASLRSLVNIDAIPEVFINSLQAVKNFFSGDAAFLETVKTVVLELGKLINLQAIPEIFTNGLNSIITLFAENQTVATVASSILNTLESFALLLGVPQTTIDNIKSFFSTFDNVQIVLDSVYEAFQRLINIDLSGISKVFEPLTNIFDNVQVQIDKIKEGLSFIPGINLTGADVEGTDKVKDLVQESLNNAVNDTSIDVKTRINTITDATNLSEQSANVLTAFNDAMATNAGALDDNLTETVNTYIAAGFNAEDIKKLATEAGVEVPAGIEAAFAQPENWAGVNTEAGTQLVNLFNSIKEELGIESPSTVARDQIGIPIIQGIAEGLGTTEGVDFTTPVANIFDAVIAASKIKLEEIATKINVVAALFTLDEVIVVKTTESLAATVELFTTSFETITTLITENLELYLELFTEFYDTMLEMMDEFVTSFLTKFDELTGQVVEKIKLLIASIKAFAPAFTEAGTSLAKAFVNGFKDYIGEDGPGRKQIESAINSLARSISNANETLNEAFANAGKSFGKPFVEGIAAGIDASRDSARLKAAVTALVNRIISEARTVAGIASPSKVAAAMVGLPIAEGIGVGIESGITFVTDGIDSLMSSISLRNTQVGESFSAGVADGIFNSTNLVTNAVKLLADESIVAARTALDINSPSRVTRDLIGLPFVQGIATALESGKGMLQPLTSDLLSVLPKNANFDLGINQDMRLKEQSIDVKYNGLLNTLPLLSQNIDLNRNLITNAALKIAPNMVSAQRERLANYTQMLMIPHQLQKQQALANTSYMNSNRSTVVNNSNEYHMHLTTSETSAARRVEKNFNSMRFGYRFR